ncbi:hypothetical protein EWI07_03855 [Sporolactobacillus sp. THM7-4]|nr:hypothetical protein EWI07_03855 [Sporolactobacillus sp. THM7-4]
MKRIVFIFLILSVILSPLAGIHESMAKSGEKVLYKGVTTASYLNVRSSPSLKSRKTGILRKGSIVEVVHTGSWLRINYRHGDGYVFGRYVKRLSSTHSPAGIRLNEPVIGQYPELARGCEVTSLAMLIRSSGKYADKMTLARQIPKVPYYSGGYYGNPNDGFVGNIYTFRKAGYAVYHGPVFHLARRFLGTRAVDLSGKSWSSVESQIRKSRPVWVIVTSKYRYIPKSTWATWRTRRGTIKITMHEHSVLVTGFDSHYVYINDPIDKAKNKKLNKSHFISGWQEFGSQAISYN